MLPHVGVWLSRIPFFSFPSQSVLLPAGRWGCPCAEAARADAGDAARSHGHCLMPPARGALICDTSGLVPLNQPDLKSVG